MKVDELIRQKAEELHRVHANDSDRLDELRSRARPSTGSRVGVLRATALAVLLIFAPIALLRPEVPNRGTEDTVTASTDDLTPPEASGGVSIGDQIGRAHV